MKRKTEKKNVLRGIDYLFIRELNDIGDDNAESFQAVLSTFKVAHRCFLDPANEAEWLSDLHTARQLHCQLWGLDISIGVTGLCQLSDKIVLTLSLYPTK